MIASIGMNIPQTISNLIGVGALPPGWTPPAGILTAALIAWLIILVAMFWKWLK